MSLASCESNPTILLHNHIGFSYNYLKNYWHRVCRAHTSALAEASSILQTHPGAKFGHDMKKARRTKQRDDYLARSIQRAMFIYLRLQEGKTDFDVNDPVAKGDKQYDVANKGVVIIFNAARDDPNCQSVQKKVDVVTDGNMPLSRKLVDDERQGLKRLAGHPKAIPENGATGKKPKSRCKAVSDVENIKISRHSIGGLFGTLNMKRARKGGGNEVLQLAEMLNGECTDYKRVCVQDLIEADVEIGYYAHDCSCVIKKQFEEQGYCDECRLDNYHKKKHKCKVKGVGKHLNSLAAEQLWSVMHRHQSTIAHLNRPHYRCFLKHYCQWRNSFVRGAHTNDFNASISRRRANRTYR